MPFWLLTALGWAKKALSALLSLARRYPLQAALIASLCANLWLWHGKTRADERARAITAASERAGADMMAAIKRQQERYNTLAKETDDAHKQALADAGDRTDRFIAARRVRPETCRAASAPAASQSEVAGSVEGTSQKADLVAVNADDVRICTENTIRLQSVKQWASQLMIAGYAE